VPKLTLFIGKGGVGKTTVSAAYGLHRATAERRKSVLLLSTDPAHSLADIFGQALGGQPEKLRLMPRARLDVWQVDAEKQFRTFLNRHKGKLLSILEDGSIFSREDIEPLLETTLPGMAEMAALLAIADALGSSPQRTGLSLRARVPARQGHAPGTSAGKYDQIVVDTAPLGHTLRLFALPQYFESFLDVLELAASRDRVLAERFGGTVQSTRNPLIAEWRQMVKTVRTALLSNAEIFLVTTPEKFSLNESRRAVVALRSISPELELSGIVLNRAVLASRQCRICRTRHDATRSAREFLEGHFSGKKIYIAEDAGAPVMGSALGPFGEHVFAGKSFVWKGVAPKPKPPEIRLSRVGWPALERPLSMVLGKGGVGKTTVSAALGFNTRLRRHAAIDICSVDPAPSLDDIFQAAISDEPRAVLGDKKFRASEMDAVAVFKAWARGVKAMIDEATSAEVSDVHVDLWFERALFSQLLESVPPGLDEILAVLRVLELVRGHSSRVLIDMAPTGHALDLLRTPDRILVWTKLLLKSLAHHRTLAMARDAAVKIAELGQSVRELLELLENPGQTRIYAVMLPEALPDRQTERLIAELSKLRLSTAAIFVNRVLFKKDVGRCRRCASTRQWQLSTIKQLSTRYAEIPLYVVRNFDHEVAGKKALGKFVSELWRPA
jgi:arsenite/tail-anchored protein-transporting ATPase